MRKTHLESIAYILSDFRQGELAAPTPDHVDRWISQFDTAVQLPMLQEMAYVLQRTYFSKSCVSNFFRNLIRAENFAGNAYCDFWKTAHILDIQQNGHSPSEIRNIFAQLLLEECNLDISTCGVDGGPYIYLDDVLFTGGRVGQDLESWIPNAPDGAIVYIVVICTHQFGEWKCKGKLQDIARANNKRISFEVWASIRIENRRSYKNNSEVLWPAVLPQDDLVSEYITRGSRFPFEWRQPNTQFESRIFSCEEGRQLLETQFLLAGLKIISFCQSPNTSMKPLGFGPFGLGFGSTIVTYRNCPNNSPLALWWGDPHMPSTHPFGRWYPLVQRKTYGIEVPF